MSSVLSQITADALRQREQGSQQFQEHMAQFSQAFGQARQMRQQREAALQMAEGELEGLVSAGGVSEEEVQGLMQMFSSGDKKQQMSGLAELQGMKARFGMQQEQDIAELNRRNIESQIDARTAAALPPDTRTVKMKEYDLAVKQGFGGTFNDFINQDAEPTTDDITEFKFAVEQGFEGSFNDFLQQGGSKLSEAEQGIRRKMELGLSRPQAIKLEEGTAQLKTDPIGKGMTFVDFSDLNDIKVTKIKVPVEEFDQPTIDDRPIEEKTVKDMTLFELAENFDVTGFSAGLRKKTQGVTGQFGLDVIEKNRSLAIERFKTAKGGIRRGMREGGKYVQGEMDAIDEEFSISPEMFKDQQTLLNNLEAVRIATEKRIRRIQRDIRHSEFPESEKGDAIRLLGNMQDMLEDIGADKPEAEAPEETPEDVPTVELSEEDKKIAERAGLTPEEFNANAEELRAAFR
jgi:hypothetical protein